ncbi:MAG: TonB C-terminal domain-containing protein [Deltaproteobacteria bacterium]|nr:TonB C-terminal domain-containing protein [Deltaproteobacteria bacterium]
MSSGGATSIRMVPFAFTPMEQLFRKMIAVSVVVHVVALGLAAIWGVFYSPPARFLSVTVVDLVGGEAFAPPPRKRARPVEEPAPPPPQKSAKEEKEPEAPPPVKAKKKSKAKDAPDAGAFTESLRKIREKRASEERLREAVVAIRREKAARKAIRQIGDRVGRRIDLSSAQPAPKSAPPSPTAGLGGATGNARVPPEHLAYFRKLDEKIRSNWTVPALTAGERENLMVRLRIVIERDGRVSQVRMEKTSGNTYFDDSVRRAINKASPLPVPPEQLRGGEDHYEIGFRFYGAGGGS